MHIVTIQSKCKAVINELNVVDPRKPETKEFIELMSTCETDLPLRGYKVIGFSCHGTSGKVELIVNLWNQRMSNGYFTIGGSEVSSANLKVPNENIKFRTSFLSKNNILSVTNFLTSDKLSAIGLLYAEKNPFNDFKLSEKKTYLLIDNVIMDILKKNLVDLVVYGERAACDKCELFEIIHNDFSAKKYTLREFPTNKEKKDISLNRCAIEGIGFIPEKFKIGVPTPGKRNDCTGPHFILEEIISNTIPPFNARSISADDHDDINGASCSNQLECTSSIDESDYSQITTEGIEQAIHVANLSSTNDICTPSFLYPDGGNVEEMIVRETSRKRQMSVDVDDLEWETTKFFK